MRYVPQCLVVLIIFAAAPAGATTTILGNGLGQDCYDTVRFPGASNSDYEICSTAIRSGTLTGDNLAATYVNRGIVLMRLKRFGEAIEDYERALKIDPELGEAMINRGTAYIGLRRYASAIESLKTALNHSPQRPHVAYYNLGVAHEMLGNYPAALEHYKNANVIAPEWRPALRKLESWSDSDAETAQKQSS